MNYDLVFDEHVAARTRDLRARIGRRPRWHALAEGVAIIAGTGAFVALLAFFLLALDPGASS